MEYTEPLPPWTNTTENSNSNSFDFSIKSPAIFRSALKPRKIAGAPAFQMLFANRPNKYTQIPPLCCFCIGEIPICKHQTEMIPTVSEWVSEWESESLSADIGEVAPNRELAASRGVTREMKNLWVNSERESEGDKHKENLEKRGGDRKSTRLGGVGSARNCLLIFLIFYWGFSNKIY